MDDFCPDYVWFNEFAGLVSFYLHFKPDLDICKRLDKQKETKNNKNKWIGDKRLKILYMGVQSTYSVLFSICCEIFQRFFRGTTACGWIFLLSSNV